MVSLTLHGKKFYQRRHPGAQLLHCLSLIQKQATFPLPVREETALLASTQCLPQYRPNMETSYPPCLYPCLFPDSSLQDTNSHQGPYTLLFPALGAAPSADSFSSSPPIKTIHIFKVWMTHPPLHGRSMLSGHCTAPGASTHSTLCPQLTTVLVFPSGHSVPWGQKPSFVHLHIVSRSDRYR